MLSIPGPGRLPSVKPPRARRPTRLAPVILAALAASVCGRGTDPLRLSGTTMGTTYEVTIVPAPANDRARGAAAIVQSRLDEVDRLMSTYNPDSELSRFNRHASTEPFPLSPTTMEVFLIAQDVSRASGGALDVTVAPVVALWGFGADASNRTPPDPQALDAARRMVGYTGLTLDEARGTIAKTRPGIRCDLSAVAKGYAVDRVVEALEAQGFTDFLVEVGGEVAGRGLRPDGRPWRVAVERPDGESDIALVVELADRAMATSGDARQAYVEQGRRLSHLIDPGTGRPAVHDVASVTVIHQMAARADALATALYVMGPDTGLLVAEWEGVPVYFLVREPGGALRAVSSPAFDALLAPAADPASGNGL